MTRFALVTPPASGDAAGDPDSVAESIEAWVGNAPLTQLVAAFGGQLPASSPDAQLEWLDAFSAEHWDFRAGQERNLARTATFDRDVESLIFDAAEALGLSVSMAPSRGHYSHVLILGGLVRACLLRSQYSAELVDGGLHTTSVAALSAYRPLRGDESELIENLGLSGHNEMEVMEVGLVNAFRLGEPIAEERHDDPEQDFATSLVRTWKRDDLSVRLVIAPSPEPEIRRANSSDTYVCWADSCAHIGPKDTLLLVTSSIYLPYNPAPRTPDAHSSTESTTRYSSPDPVVTRHWRPEARLL